jgi:hypothetical protein
MGYVRLNIGVGNGRTIMPSSPTFQSYRADFTATSGGNTETGVVLTVSSNSATHVLVAGTYTVKVTAYTSSDASAPAAEKSVDGIIINSTTGGTGTFALEPIKSGSSGTFEWNITLPMTTDTIPVPDVDTATITISQYGGGGTPVSHSLKTTHNNVGSGITLAAGYYYVDVTVKNEASGYATVAKRDLAHIYAGMTTTYIDSFMTFAVNEYDVTYANVDGSGISATQSDDLNPYTHGTLITNYYSGEGTGGANPVDTTNSYQFGGWYKKNGGTWENTDKWDFTTSKIIAETTLYARWIQPSLLTAGITYSHPTGTTLNFNPSSISFSQADIGSASSITINITNAAGSFAAGSVKWFVGTNELTSTNSANGSLTFDFEDEIDMLVIGHPYTITITAEVGGEPFSGTIALTITQ